MGPFLISISMKDKDKNLDEESFSEKPKRKRGRPRKKTDPSIEKGGDIPTDSKKEEPIPKPVKTDADDIDNEELMSQMVAELLRNSVDKYSEEADKHFQEQREDFDSLQPIVSEFLDDFIIIGHTIEGQRVVMRYTPTPAGLDSLTELCKKVLVRMMIEEQSGG
jgi:hypothetical protein